LHYFILFQINMRFFITFFLLSFITEKFPKYRIKNQYMTDYQLKEK